MSTLLDLTIGFLKCVLSNGPTVETVEIFSSSFLVSNLLPTIIAHLGPIALLQTKVLYLFTHLSICDLSSHLFILHTLIHPFIYPSVHPSIHWQHSLSLFYLVISNSIGYHTTYTSCCIFNCIRILKLPWGNKWLFDVKLTHITTHPFVHYLFIQPFILLLTQPAT